MFETFCRKVNFEPNDYVKIQESTLDSTFKGALVSSNDEIIYLNRLNYPNFTYTVCNEAILTVPVVFYLRHNSYVTEIFDKAIDNLKSAGLIDYWISHYIDGKYLRIKSNDRPHSKLSFQELLGTMQLFVIGMSFSVFTFLLELSLQKILIFLSNLSTSGRAQ